MMDHSARSLPTFTTVDMLYHRQKCRWMLGVEKLASLGFPMSSDIAELLEVALWLHSLCFHDI